MALDNQMTLDTWLSNSPKAVGQPSRSQSTQQQPPADTDQLPSGDKQSLYSNRRANLSKTAKETLSILTTTILPLLPPSLHPASSVSYHLSSLPALSSTDCPRLPQTAIRIVNADSFNVAISLSSFSSSSSSSQLAATATATNPSAQQSRSRVAVLNMASHSSPGGGFLSGAMAQEEALCYRSSLYLSLHKRYYPWRQKMGIYTRDVVIVRDDYASGHKLLIPSPPLDVQPKHLDLDLDLLPVVSVLSIAAVRRPRVRRVRESTPSGDGHVLREVFASQDARDLTKDKMRLCLRMAGLHGHRRLVLGALGCGAFRNPKEEVASCWLEVLQDAEFQGGRWEEVVFAVYDVRNEGNFEVFEKTLGGVKV